jgi:hypothetical protein
MANLSELDKALRTFLVVTANDFKTSIGGRLYPGLAPEGATYPYCTYTLITNIPERDSETRFENPDIQFNIYQKRDGSERVKFIADKLKARLDDAENSFDPTGYFNISVDRINENDLPVQDLSTEGYLVEYIIFLQEI